jgi:hypothetical protein
MGDEQLYDIEVAFAGRPLHGTSDEIAAEGIDLCALLEEVATCRELSVDGRPMKRRDVLLVAVRSARATGLYELSDEVDVAALSGQENARLLLTAISTTAVT